CAGLPWAWWLKKAPSVYLVAFQTGSGRLLQKSPYAAFHLLRQAPNILGRSDRGNHVLSDQGHDQGFPPQWQPLDAVPPAVAHKKSHHILERLRQTGRVLHKN